MSGSHRATEYPPYQPMQEPVYGVPQQPYEQSYEQPHPSYEAYGQPAPQEYGQGGYQSYQSYQQSPDGYVEAYDQPFQPYGAEPEQFHQEPVYEPEPVYGQSEPVYQHSEPVYEPEPAYEPEPVYVPEPLAPVVPVAAAAPVSGSRAAARGRRRKAKQKRHGKAVMAGTALLVAATAGWYAVGQNDAKPGLTAADGPGPEGVNKPDQPAPAAAQAAADRQSAPAAAARGEARADLSVAAIPGLGATFTAKIPAETTQVVVASGADRNTDKNTVVLWTRTPEGRWLAGETWQGHNGKNGWTADHNEGDLRSPIGVYSLTDAGGRKDDPGSKLPYDKDPSFVVSGTGFFGDQLAGSFDYVVAINYNRVAGNSPLDTRRPMGARKGGGIWLHVDHDGPTHGCVSIPEDKMAQLIRTLDPAAHPVIVMGDAPTLAT
ncbi:L,D-transpeptidase family protein [Streptomyces sp. 1331.2]|uniref:L,D-transpeptidase family protein n=1 Tax=Streptomyces sp. 1331.2 TaxID=1938835 RepID=UPI000BD0185A|nr:L,D-transpeptidase family protein [Streptomyces sp. 1331.2]SOB83511.1 L,D-peptidoglycan transpeptidase YkuD, ErfK/YbiS/YcfS/YnhG family [Streptomyces sp. 1331.2]